MSSGRVTAPRLPEAPRGPGGRARASPALRSQLLWETQGDGSWSPMEGGGEQEGALVGPHAPGPCPRVGTPAPPSWGQRGRGLFTLPSKAALSGSRSQGTRRGARRGDRARPGSRGSGRRLCLSAGPEPAGRRPRLARSAAWCSRPPARGHRRGHVVPSKPVSSGKAHLLLPSLQVLTPSPFPFQKIPRAVCTHCLHSARPRPQPPRPSPGSSVLTAGPLWGRASGAFLPGDPVGVPALTVMTLRHDSLGTSVPVRGGSTPRSCTGAPCPVNPESGFVGPLWEGVEDKSDVGVLPSLWPDCPREVTVVRCTEPRHMAGGSCHAQTAKNRPARHVREARTRVRVSPQLTASLLASTCPSLAGVLWGSAGTRGTVQPGLQGTAA